MDKSVETISAAVNRFAKDLYKIISESAEGNVFFSPFSIATALSMLHMGSKENTEQQIMTGMHLPEDKELIKKAFFKVISDYKLSNAEYELRTSNMAYIAENIHVLDEFLDAIKTCYLSSVKNVNFQSEAEKITKEINITVEKETKSKIKNLIPSGVLKPNTVLVLVNAIYFKGNWSEQFKEQFTKKKPFWISKTESVKVPMMYQENDFRLRRDLGDLKASLLALDYKGSRMRFVILLPDARDGLSDLEKKLESVDLGSLDNEAYSTKVKVYIPKFKLEESVNLNSVLKNLGMTDMFVAGKCDLSGFSSEKLLYVSEVLHKAFIEVNEEGCEAAAATAVVVNIRCATIDRELPFVADHPFIFYIKDKKHDNIIFMGKFVKP